MNSYNSSNNIQRRKTLGMRKPMAGLLNGYVTTVRQPEPLTLTDTHTHKNHVCTGAQVTPPVGPALTSYTIPCESSRVKDLQFANSVDHNEIIATCAWRQLTAKYKQMSIKQANAAHHDKFLTTHKHPGTLPSGIYNPIYSTLMEKIHMPFKSDELYKNKMADIATNCANEVLELLIKSWDRHKCTLKDEVSDLKKASLSSGRSLKNDTEYIEFYEI
ncbi:MAG: hypothetical protein KZQ70_13115 [gamma proteobacterium symbiont of Lucinoma myriamae]|nr:hypothetical protein [gamma proteobacterium symbiont of Lucinoma myriamae]